VRIAVTTFQSDFCVSITFHSSASFSRASDTGHMPVCARSCTICALLETYPMGTATFLDTQNIPHGRPCLLSPEMPSARSNGASPIASTCRCRAIGTQRCPRHVVAWSPAASATPTSGPRKAEMLEAFDRAGVTLPSWSPKRAALSPAKKPGLSSPRSN